MISGMPGIATANILIVQQPKDTQRSITRDILCRFAQTYPHTPLILPLSSSFRGQQWALTLQCKVRDALWLASSQDAGCRTLLLQLPG